MNKRFMKSILPLLNEMENLMGQSMLSKTLLFGKLNDQTTNLIIIVSNIRLLFTFF